MADYSKKRFLVIDDQPQARDALRTIAQQVGAFAVEFATNYQDAIFRIRNNTPDIILCDYMLGEGRSGQQMLEELRRFSLLPDETIFMMVTGEQSYEQVVSAVELIPDDYIIKPFSPDKLLLRLDRIVAKKLFFAGYYKEKRKQEYANALAILEASRDSEAGRPYRFEILRQRAEVFLASGDVQAAEAAYRNILDNYEFPWARAGVARSLHKQNRLRRHVPKSTGWLPAHRTFSMPATSRPASAWPRANTPKPSRSLTTSPKKRRATTCASGCSPRPPR